MCPPATHALVECYRVGQSLASGGDQADGGLLGLLLRDEELEIADRSQSISLPGQVQRLLGGLVRGGLRRQGLGVVVQSPEHVSHVAQCLQDGLPVVRLGGGECRLGGPGLGGQAGVEQGLRQLTSQSPDQRTAAEETAQGERLPSEIGAQGDPWILFGDDRAVLGVGGVQQSFGGLNVGSLPRQFRGHAKRQFGRQSEVGQGELRYGPAPRRPTDQHRHQMVRLLQPVAQRRNGGAGLFHLGLQRQDVVLGGSAQRKTLARQFELLLLGCQNGLVGPDLLGQLRLKDGRRDDIRCQREARPFKLVALVVGLRGEGLEGATVAAEEIQVVADAYPCVVQIESPVPALLAGGGVVDSRPELARGVIRERLQPLLFKPTEEGNEGNN